MYILDSFFCLLQVLPNGNLVFPPFRAEDYRQEVHAQVYSCLARSPAGSVHSRDVNVRAGKCLLSRILYLYGATPSVVWPSVKIIRKRKRTKTIDNLTRFYFFERFIKFDKPSIDKNIFNIYNNIIQLIKFYIID